MGSKSDSLFRYADNTDKLLMLLGAVGSIGDGMMTPLVLLVLSGVIDEYANASHSITIHSVNKYSIRLLYVAVAVGASAFIEGVCWTRTAERQTSRIRTEYLKSLLGQEVGYFDSQDSSSTTFQVISSISTDAHTIQDVIAEKIPNCIARLAEFVSGYTFGFILSWRLALSSIPFVLCFMIPGVILGKKFMGFQQKTKAEYEVAGNIAEQALSSVRTVYSYVGEHQTLERFHEALNGSMKLGIKSGFAKGLMIGSCGMMFAAWSFLAWAGSYLVNEKGENGGRVFMTICNVIVAGLGCMGALPNISFISAAKNAATSIFKMIDLKPEIDIGNGKGKVLAQVRGEIEFQEVYFSYPSRPDTRILQGLSLKIKAGKTVGLVGGSGSGKSTTVALIERFYDPVKGDILLDGYKIKKLQLKWLRTQIGLVNQEPVLFATSIKENILFGKERASMEMVIKACKAANAHDFIVKLPNGYETHVGQFGAQLSGGQKQRIAIARAILKDPRILLLDEATSALDAESEQVVQQALDKASQGRTTIIIAHRLTTIRKADKIVVLQTGRVAEIGSHEELMRMNNGVYIGMVQLQQSATSNETIDNNNNYNPSEKRNNRRIRHSSTPKTPVSFTPSWHNSPASPFISGIGMSPAISNLAYSYYDSDDEDHEYFSNPSPSQWRLMKMNAPEWKRALLGCLGSIGFGAVQPVHALCLGSLVSVYFVHGSAKLKSDTRTFCIIFLCLGIIAFFSNLLQHYNFAIMGERVTMRVREQMLKNILSFEIGWFDLDENTSAAICARLASDASLVRSLVGERMSLVVQVFTSASIAFIVGLILTWRVAAVMIATQPLVIASMYSRSVLMKAMSIKAQKAQNEGSQLASEAVVNHRTITAFSSQDRILNLFLASLVGPKRESVKQSWISGIGLFCSQFITAATMALTYWYGGRLMNQGLVSSNHLFIAFFLLMSTGKNIADAGSISTEIARGGKAIKSVFAILDRFTEIDPEGDKTNTKIKGKVELKNVYFSYPSRPEQMIFQNLNLKIESGKTMALVGESGSGKSTVIGLIERFYDPMKGLVLIDEKDIKSYNLRELRSHIALVSQEPTLFAGTIRENIIYGKEDATEAEIRKASKQANAEEFISSMKDGYETYCGERGVQLSGGQKQRIALARSILKNPSILLLDEATSALDSVSENLVQEALEKMMVGRTCVVVAHRLSTIQKSDIIAVIKNGKVVEQGSHMQLLARGSQGSYKSLISLQLGHSS